VCGKKAINWKAEHEAPQLLTNAVNGILSVVHKVLGRVMMSE